MNRREVLRLVSTVTALLAPCAPGDDLDAERWAAVAEGSCRLDRATVDGYVNLSAKLWGEFSQAKSKAAVFPAVRRQLDVVAASLQSVQDQGLRRRVCGILGDLFQLAGEVFLDDGRYTDAAHCYTLAATACSEAEAYDLWACAMTRHAFIGIYEGRPGPAKSMLALAARLASRGSSSLSTRHWVSIVTAQACAGVGDMNGCQRALGEAEKVNLLNGAVRNGGWLRFDGSRLAEERGACYVELRRPDLAEPALTQALSMALSPRRRGLVLADLAMVGVQRRDPDLLVMYADAALDTVRQTGSRGVVGRRLHGLQQHLAPFVQDRHVRNIRDHVTALLERPAT